MKRIELLNKTRYSFLIDIDMLLRNTFVLSILERKYNLLNIAISFVALQS